MVFLEVKVQVQHAALEVIAEAGLAAAIPLAVHDLRLTTLRDSYAEGHVLVGSAGVEPNHAPIRVCLVGLHDEGGLLRLVHEVWGRRC